MPRVANSPLKKRILKKTEALPYQCCEKRYMFLDKDRLQYKVRHRRGGAAALLRPSEAISGT